MALTFRWRASSTPAKFDGEDDGDGYFPGSHGQRPPFCQWPRRRETLVFSSRPVFPTSSNVEIFVPATTTTAGDFLGDESTEFHLFRRRDDHFQWFFLLTTLRELSKKFLINPVFSPAI
ncbi:hypothetical protein M6B38_397560 [Iris pallida]|uniref:Uncharacterized protein n=1 Tax=Iris pallida TaxID=29817 RepID=A0AAX6EES1_IRIPA|nr:hypothetical protein M6B38_192300 [Iris pallida]KAJ6820593.1 hypothetical protein M6B38_397560 [Iris pallida]